MRLIASLLASLALAVPAFSQAPSGFAAPYTSLNMPTPIAFGADPMGVADSTTAINYCLQNYSLCVLPPVPVGSTGYQCTALSWGTNTYSVLWKLPGAFLNCADPISAGNNWVEDWTSTTRTFYGGLNLPNVNLLTLPSMQLTTNPSASDNSFLVPSTNWVRQQIGSLNPATSVAAATALAALSNSPVYSNGTAGVGATLTAASNGALTVDGYTVLLNDRVLVNDQVAQLQNGVYSLTTLGDGSTHYVLTRATDFNTVAAINGSGGIPIINGTANNNLIGILDNAITSLGTTAIHYTLVAQPATTQPHAVTFNISGAGSTITTGATGQYIETEYPSTTGIYKVITTGTASTAGSSCSITVDIWKLNAAVPTSSNKISASAPATLSSAQYSSNTTNTGWTKTVTTGDVFSASVASVTGCISATVQVWWK